MKSIIRSFAILLLSAVLYSCSSSNAPQTGTTPSGPIVYDVASSSNSSVVGIYWLQTDGTSKMIGPNMTLVARPIDGNIIGLRTDGDSIAFVKYSVVDTTPHVLFRVSGYPRDLAVAPDGNRLFYTTDGSDLRVRDLSSAQETKMQASPNGSLSWYWMQTPVFSPDSKQVAIAYVDNSIFHITIAEVQSAVLRPLPDTVLLASVAADPDPHSYDWTPDGTLIYIGATASSSMRALKRYDPKTGVSETLVSDSSIQPTSVKVSPSGRYVLYETFYTNTQINNSYSVCTPVVYDLVSKSSTRLSLPYQLVNGSLAAYDWSPDSKSLILRTSESNLAGTQFIGQSFTYDVASATVTAAAGFQPGTIGHLWWGRPATK
ncbi:MAG: hypothetical protein JSS75_09280 [Bacteroidetes bacterium]|nr:hypothetical protein [Bacteroidota bacterium]